MEEKTKEIDSVIVNWLHPPVVDVDPVTVEWGTVTIYTDGTIELDVTRPTEDQILKRIKSYKQEASYRHDGKPSTW